MESADGRAERRVRDKEDEIGGKERDEHIDDGVHQVIQVHETVD